MRKNIIISMLLLVVLTGCINTGFLADPDEEVKKYYEQAQTTFDFDENDFPYTAVGCWRQILCESGASGFQFDFEPQGGFKYLKIRRSGYAFGTLNVTDNYLKNYLLNDLIENREYGNKLDEYFLKLEDMGIKYYIQTSDGILNKESYLQLTSKGTATCVLDMPFDSMESKVNSYLNGKDARTIDWMQFIQDFNCKPEVTIYIRENALNKAGVTIEDMQKLAEDYYNEKYVKVNVIEPIFVEGENGIYYTDSTEDYRYMDAEEEQKSYAPVYNWDK